MILSQIACIFTAMKKTGKTEARFSAKAVGARLRAVRTERGYTQSGLAERVGIPQNVLSEYESGRHRISSDLLGQLAVELSVTTDELMGLKKRMGRHAEPPGLKALKRMEKLRTLPPDDQERILKSVDLMIDGAKVPKKKRRSKSS